MQPVNKNYKSVVVEDDNIVAADRAERSTQRHRSVDLHACAGQRHR